MNLFVANISYKATQEELLELFNEFAEVNSCTIAMDKKTGKSRGFGFVKIDDDKEAKYAIQELDGFDFMGRKLVVKRADAKGKGKK